MRTTMLLRTQWTASLLLLLFPACSPLEHEKQHSTYAFRRICNVDPEIVGLQRDAETGEYRRVAVEGLSTEYDASDSTHEMSFDDYEEWIQGIGESSNDPIDGTKLASEDSDVIFVRVCSCHASHLVYCPLDVSSCGVIRRYNETIHGPSPLGCLNRLDKMDEFAQLAFLVSFLWLGVILTCLFCTRWGHNCLHFTISSCIPGYIKCRAWYLWRRDPDRAREMILCQVERALLRRLAQGGQTLDSDDTIQSIDVSGPQQKLATSLVLSTCRFRAEKSTEADTTEQVVDVNDGDNDDEDGFDNQCIICFQSLQDRDRIGNLSCSHIFHADCLKTWLKRRNACPLCNRGLIASPRYYDDMTKDAAVDGNIAESQHSSIPTTETSYQSGESSTEER